MAKGSKDIDESDPKFIGCYVGDLSYPRVKELVESSDLVLSLGAVLSDFNTGSFSYSLDNAKVVEFHSDYTQIKSAQYPGIRMKELLGKLVEDPNLIKTCSKIPAKKLVTDNFEPLVLPPDHKLTQSWLWSNLGSWLKEGDVIVTETGTSNFGIVQTKFPKMLLEFLKFYGVPLVIQLVLLLVRLLLLKKLIQTVELSYLLVMVLYN